jgi:membrane-associated phospholipid phosphatase
VDPDPIYRRLLWRSLIALALCAVLVTICYFYVDRPVAFFVHDHALSRGPVLKDLTYPPPILQRWTPVALAALLVRRAWGPFRRWEQTLLAACLSLLVADQCRQTLGHVFGRDWPNTWIHDNPSLIGTGAYGFHPFHGSEVYGSFPSGHTARTLAVVAVLWIAYPRWRWIGVLASVAVAVGLVGMNYHFVGDVIAGGFVGAIVGVYVAHGFGLVEKRLGQGRPCRPARYTPEHNREGILPLEDT